MKKLLLNVSCLLIALSSYAQRLPLHLNNDSNRYQYPPLYVLKTPNNKPFISASPNGFYPNSIDSINVLKDIAAIKAYGRRAKYGAIIISYKINIAFTESDSSKLTNVLQTYYPGLKMDNLPLYIDSVWIKYPKLVCLAPGKIKSAKIETEKSTGIKFIDIITTDPPPAILKDGEIMIRIRGKS